LARNSIKAEAAAGESVSVSAQAPALAEDPFRAAVLLLAAAVTALIILTAYFSDRHGDVDEIALSNATYMAAHYGKMTYPAQAEFEIMVAHPPGHYEAVAVLMRMGFSL